MVEFCLSLAACDLSSVPLIPCGNNAQLGGGSVAEGLMSTLAYGWVERCSDLAGCGQVLNNISVLVHFSSAITLLFHES